MVNSFSIQLLLNSIGFVKNLLILVLFFLPLFHFAQQITVLDVNDKTPLPGATVSFSNVNGYVFYLSSNVNGQIQLQEKQFNGANFLMIQVSFIGYKTINDTIFKDKITTLLLQSKPYMVDDVVITAQYAPTSVESSVHKVKVISRQKIENMAAVNLKDVLTNELNVRLSQDNILGSGMSLQGISGQNVKILIDGVPVIGRLDGQIDLNQINLNNVERIEIVEGPLSVNFGSNALAGTINIITKKEQKEKVNSGVNSYTENIGTYNLDANVGISLHENHNVNVSVGRNYFDGWNAEDNFFPSFKAQRADSGRAQQWNPKEQYFGRLQYNLNFKELLISYKGELFNETITNRGLPIRTRNGFAAFDDYYHTKRIDNALFVQGKLNNNWNVNWTAAYNNFQRVKEAHRKNLVTLESIRIPETPGNDLQDTSTFYLLMSRGSITSTKDSSWINYELGYDINVENATGKRIADGQQTLGDYAVFATTEVKITKGLLMKPAVRYSYNTQYKAPLTPSINIKYAQNNSTIRFSYAKGFRAPSLKELYFNFDDVNHSLFGNSNLKAEQSNNYSASIRQKVITKDAVFKTEISGFYNEIYNQISFAQSSIGGGDTLVYFNIGENRTKGINANFSAHYELLTLNIGSSYIGRYNRLADENLIDEFSYSTEFMANFTYNLKKPSLTIAVFAKHQGELPGFGYDIDGEVQKQTITSYQIVDATVSKSFWQKRINLAIGCKNITDVQNVQANLSGGAHSGGESSISIGTGRTVFIRLAMNFNSK